HGDRGEPLYLRIRDARERDTRQVAHTAARTVAADEIPGGHAIGNVRPAYLGGHRGLVLAQSHHLVSATDLCAELASEVVEDALELRLRERKDLHRRILQWREVHVHPAPRQPGGRDGGSSGRFESLQLASEAQQLQDLSA